MKSTEGSVVKNPVSSKANGHYAFDHALNDDMIRLAQMELALSRLASMAERRVDMRRIEQSLLHEMASLRERIEVRARQLPTTTLMQ